jgi:signal transduction histidine kinase
VNEPVERWEDLAPGEVVSPVPGTVATFAPTAASAEIARLAGVAGALLAARTVGARLRVAADALAEHLERPVAVGLRSSDEPAVAGDPVEWPAAERAFAEAREDRSDLRIGARIRREGAVHVHAGAAEIVVLDPPRGAGRFLEAVATVLAEAIDAAAIDDAMSLAWAAHEIRSPLSAVRTVLDQTLRSDDSGFDRSLIERGRDELVRVAATVESLLRWSDPRVERLATEPASLAEIVRGVIADADLELPTDRIVHEAFGDAVVDVDRVQFTVALANLLRNALAYSDGAVRVSVTVEGGVASVTVSDEGTDAYRELTDDAFEPFVRGADAVARSRGSGLGLFISRRIVEAHGGAITLAPASSGTVARIDLPVVTQGSRCAS